MPPGKPRTCIWNRAASHPRGDPRVGAQYIVTMNDTPKSALVSGLLNDRVTVPITRVLWSVTKWPSATHVPVPLVGVRPIIGQPHHDCCTLQGSENPFTFHPSI
ncbi:hypothetical protein AVEN_229043-1 [Araneus ventricosus]|uniref:Uncharacterized protein n=1 Tax=Araneus ventricosus TaxID=182803 RepID=A0A4Y2CZ70_ARAVE|nr:hypothetical protein AVEN_229043-1 [Araneus ventricosus]